MSGKRPSIGPFFDASSSSLGWEDCRAVNSAPLTRLTVAIVERQTQESERWFYALTTKRRHQKKPRWHHFCDSRNVFWIHSRVWNLPLAYKATCTNLTRLDHLSVPLLFTMEPQETSWAEHKVSRWDKIWQSIPFHLGANDSGSSNVIAKKMKSFDSS